MIPIELIGHLARPISLSVRLFGNIFGEDAVLLILLYLVPLLIPLPVMLLAIFTSVVQTFIFVMLSMVYIAGAEEAEHGELVAA
jgi:F-type H+-transporting ATPase subunit a